MGHRLGIHWMRHHQDDNRDFAHIARMGYKSFTLFEECWSNAAFCDKLLETAPHDAIFILRDHPLSEEQQAFASDPAGTGSAHGQSWVKKTQEGKIRLPKERTYFAGINEPDTNFLQRQTDVYTTHFAKSLAAGGLLCGGWSFGVGHPSTVGLVPTNPVDWSWYAESAQTLRRLKGIAVIHEYWVRGNYNWGNWVGRFAQSCPYDIPYVVTETLYDGGVISRPKEGYKFFIDLGRPEEVREMLAELNGYMSRLSTDPRFHSAQCFTYDFAHPWDSFDITPILKFFEEFPWVMASEQEKHKVVLPKVVAGPGATSPASGGLLLPIRGPFTVTQRFGENPANYARFGIPGHNGTDYAAPEGADVVSIADGRVEWVGEDTDYGKYVRVHHPQLGFHSFYAHLSATSVRQGEPIRQGTVVGEVGSTGNSTGPHLHLEIRLADSDGGYSAGTSGYGKGRVDPETVYAVLNRD